MTHRKSESPPTIIFMNLALEKNEVHEKVDNFKIAPWTIELGGLIGKPQKIDVKGSREENETRRAHLPFSVRRSLVHGHTLDGVSSSASSFIFMDPKPEAKFIKFTTFRDDGASPILNFSRHIPDTPPQA